MAGDELRVGLDANVLIAGMRFPRWPYEVLWAAARELFMLVLPAQVIDEARRYLDRAQRRNLDRYLAVTRHEEIAMPLPDAVAQNLDLVRSAKDVPIALALLAGNVDVFVTNDRDFTDPGATAVRFRERVRVMLPAVFLRDVMGWQSEELEAIRHRRWEDVTP
jgi:predicted nucleic acid-binding protein